MNDLGRIDLEILKERYYFEVSDTRGIQTSMPASLDIPRAREVGPEKQVEMFEAGDIALERDEGW